MAMLGGKINWVKRQEGRGCGGHISVLKAFNIVLHASVLKGIK
jgi:hypothetical protein